MNQELEKIFIFVRQQLQQRGDHDPFDENTSLFISGRMDSLEAMQTILFMEKNFAVDFSQLDFSLDLIDTPQDLLQLALESEKSAR